MRQASRVTVNVWTLNQCNLQRNRGDDGQKTSRKMPLKLGLKPDVWMRNSSATMHLPVE